MSNRTLIGSAVICLMFAAAGCQSHDAGKVLDVGVKDAPPPPTNTGSLTGYCPMVSLREGTSYYTNYANLPKKKDDASTDAAAGATDQASDKKDPNAVIYQAAVGDVTRTCKTDSGTLSMTVAVAGKIVPGPQGKAGSVTVPIRIAAVRGDEVLYSKLTNFPVNVADVTGATQFVFTDPNVTFPAPTERNVQIYAGFDDQPKVVKASKPAKRKVHHTKAAKAARPAEESQPAQESQPAEKAPEQSMFNGLK